MTCKCGHSRDKHNLPDDQGGANWAPIGCYHVLDRDRPGGNVRICSCIEYREKTSAQGETK